jgi:hypothetical protein
MTRRTEFPVFIDPAEKHPVGSAEWSGRISSRSMHEFERVESDVQRLVKTLPGSRFRSTVARLAA